MRERPFSPGSYHNNPCHRHPLIWDPLEFVVVWQRVLSHGAHAIRAGKGEGFVSDVDGCCDGAQHI